MPSYNFTHTASRRRRLSIPIRTTILASTTVLATVKELSRVAAVLTLCSFNNNFIRSEPGAQVATIAELAKAGVLSISAEKLVENSPVGKAHMPHLP